MKRDLSVPIGLGVVSALFGGVFVLTGISTASADTGDAPAPASTSATPYCQTFDDTIRDSESINPDATYIVLGAGGGATETTKGRPGPEAQKRIADAVADLEKAKAEAIARGDSCIGVIEP